MAFNVGQEVECINDAWGELAAMFAELGRTFPKKGGRYVIKKIGPAPGRFTDHICPHLMLVGYEYGIFASCHFRPIQKTDISIFTAMLAPTKVDADA